MTYASECTFSSNPTITGLPASVACSNGKAKETITLPVNSGSTAVTYSFKLRVRGVNAATSKAKTTAVVGAAQLTGVGSVASDGYGYCALLSTGGVDCWGDNQNGELGNGVVGGPDGSSMNDYDTPQVVTGLTDAVSVTDSMGADNYCALLSTGGVDCWGKNETGELGNATINGPDGADGYDTPQPVAGVNDAISVTNGGDNYCALLSTGEVDCWGDNGGGEVGNGTIGGPDGPPSYTGYDTPQPVTGLSDAVSITYGFNGSYCAVLSNGGVDCWGYNGGGQLGNGTINGPDGVNVYDTPQPVAGVNDAVTVTSDEYAGYCALLSSGGVDCWGYNGRGELGNGTLDGPDGEDGYDTPQPVAGLSDADLVTNGDDSSYCALLSTRTMDCWGNNGSGQLGNGVIGGPDAGGYDTPQPVTGLSNVFSATNGDVLGGGEYSSYCALLSSGTMDCWGDNGRGQLGNGVIGGPDGAVGDDTPQPVTGITEPVSVIGSGLNQSYCALLSTGGVDCWGYNHDGEVGNGTIGGPNGTHGNGHGYDTPQPVSE